MVKGFWANLKKPIIGFSPMDGVTDAACRYIVDKYGHADVLFTEFTSVEGINYGAATLLEAFIHHKTTTPTVAQIFGADPEAFYKVAFIIGEMGFDGIDINMGCPDHHVAKKGGGAGLILMPQLAQQIIRQTQKGTEDWAKGTKIDDIGLKPAVLEYIENYKKIHDIHPIYNPLPVSVKTRIGYADIVTEQWISTLLEVEPVNITLHGRTLQQLYTGQADWNEIAKAAKLAHQTETLLLGNGDVKSLKDAHERIEKYSVDGVLIGRAAFGNPWVFTDSQASLQKRFDTALEHCRVFAQLQPEGHFLSLRKHLAWYCKGFDGANATRMQLMKVNTLEDVENLLNQTSQSLPSGQP